MSDSALMCGDVLDISVVGQKHAEFKQVLAAREAIEISAGELQRIDGAGIQLLVALFHQAHQENVEINWKDTSDSLYEAASVLGASAQLKLD